MVISISSTSKIVESEVTTISPMLIMEDIGGYVQQWAEFSQEDKKFLVMSSEKSRSALQGLSRISWWKCTRNRKKKRQVTTPPPCEEDEDLKTRNLLPPYITPRRSDEPNIRVLKMSRYLLVAPMVPEGFKLLHNILSNLHKLSFTDHDMNI